MWNRESNYQNIREIKDFDNIPITYVRRKDELYSFISPIADVKLRQLPTGCFDDLERFDVVSFVQNEIKDDKIFIQHVKETYKYVCDYLFSLKYVNRLEMFTFLMYNVYDNTYHHELNLAVAKLLSEDGFRITINTEKCSLFIEWDNLPILKYVVDSHIYNENIL